MENEKKVDFWGDFFYMNRLVTPKIIKIVNMVFIVLVALGLLVSLITSIVAMGFFGIVTFLGMVIGAAISYIFFRMFLEIAIILFRIEENTRAKKK
jgi:hypothetical protein